MIDKDCVTCDIKAKKCTSCNKSEFKVVIGDGSCGCDIFYEIDINSNKCKATEGII